MFLLLHINQFHKFAEMIKTNRILQVTFVSLLFFVTSCTTNEQAYVEKVSKNKAPKNIILLIGDGMGVTQVYAGMTANKGKLNLEETQYVGLIKTYSASNYITDSGAGGTAMSIGKKTYNGAIGVDKDTVSHKNILEIYDESGKSTGVISTSSITHATPASFIAHNKSRHDYEGIAEDFLTSPVDVFVGGGIAHFNQREDGRILTDELKEKGFGVYFSVDSAKNAAENQLAVLTADKHNPPEMEGRGQMLIDATRLAIEKLSANDEGFFLMVEGSQIDWGGHDNNLDYVISEMLDFDRAIGVAMDFAKSNDETLVVITSDHETGGLALTGGNIETGEVEGAFPTDGHTSVMVPVFAYGPGAEMFSGIYENTDIFNYLARLHEQDK